MKKFRLQANTDTIDIESKCLGISAWVDGDSLNSLNVNRGLHIQIRHNKNEEVFKAANELAHLLSAAPEMYIALKQVISVFNVKDIDSLKAFAMIERVKYLINKAERKSTKD